MNDAPERIKYVPIDVQNIYTAVDDALKRAFWAGYEAHKEFVEEQEPQQPTADWSRAPDEATHHAFNSRGNGEWLQRVGGTPTIGYGPYMADWIGANHIGFSRVLLEVGIDWRTTLQQRPQEVTA